MSMIQRCGVLARRLMASHQPATPLPTSSVLGSASESMTICGRGDKRTKKGKRFKGSYGNSRPKREKMIERLKDKLEVPRSTPWPLPFKII